MLQLHRVIGNPPPKAASNLKVDAPAMAMPAAGVDADFHPHPLWDRSPGNQAILRMSRPMLQRACSTCSEETDLLQRKEEDAPDPEPTPRRPQAKIALSQPGDPYEREADQVADHVAQRMPLPGSEAAVPAAEPMVQRACDACQIPGPDPEEAAETETEEAETEGDDAADTPASGKASPKRESGAHGRENTGDLQAGMAASASDARPLPVTVRQDMEAAFGQDFGRVRIHTGPESDRLNRSIRAKAFTYGSDVFFNRGQFNPASPEGRHLLAHELTHVVQQTGSRAIQPKIQRSVDGEAKIGNWAHKRIQEELRGKDDKLITEAPIPGGTRDEKKINAVGFADFYKADQETMSGIVANEPQASKDQGDAAKAFYEYKNMGSDKKGGAQSKSPMHFGPTITDHKTDTWNFKANFPNKFQIGELKPLFPRDFPSSFIYHGTAATALIQVGNYIQGFEAFAKRVFQDKPKHQGSLPPAITGSPLHIPDTRIPEALNYGRFEQERQTLGKGAVPKKDTDQRVWMYRLKDGVYVYFLVDHPYDSKEFPGKIDKQLQKLDPLLLRLREKRPAMGDGLMKKPLPSIQRKEDKWKTAAKGWEDERQVWVKGSSGSDKPKDFLKKDAKAVKRKAKIDKKIGLVPAGKLGEQVKQVKKVTFWSGYRGKILGALRFRFGHVFDKVEDFFVSIKEKFRKHHAKSDKLIEKNGIFSGWKKEATSVIIQFGVEILKQMLVEAFRGFINCINGVIEVIQKKFAWVVDESRKEIVEEIAPLCCEIMEFKEKAEGEYRKHEETLASFTETIETIREWREILNYVEVAVRLGVQALSCGTPPALGCLWGLVAQIGISTGLKLLSRTDYFKDEIARPAARRLMDAIVGDTFHNFLIGLLDKTPLKPFLEEADGCKKRNRSAGGNTIGGNLHKLDPNDPANAKARAEWEKEHAPEILADLQKVFEKGKGQKITAEDLNKLLELIRKSDKSAEEIKALLEAARDPRSGKMSLEKAEAHVESGEAPAAEAKKRTIDYPKARTSNEKFQKILGWDPITFYPKPGIEAGSDEFADAVYDMQEALGKKADGILGEETLIAFYDRNKLKKDQSYKDAGRMREDKKAAKEKAAQEKADKAAQEKDKADGKEDKEVGKQGGKGGGAGLAIRVEKPPAGTPLRGGEDPYSLQSSPGWVSIPHGKVSPSKENYESGEKVELDVLYWVENQWVWFPGIAAEFDSLSSFNDAPMIILQTRENYYYKLSSEAEGVYLLEKGKGAYFLDGKGLL